MQFNKAAAKAIIILALASQLQGCLSSSATTAPASSSTDAAKSSVATSSSIVTISSSLNTSSSSALPVVLGAKPTITVLPWNGAQGAYSIIMDDYCLQTSKSLQWADSVAYSHQLSIAFAVVAGRCTADDWAKAVVMIKHGSEAVNHSDKHTCSDPAHCQGSTPWLAGSAQLFYEVDTSTRLIQTNTGIRPTFFGYPFDVATDVTQDALKSLGYLGSRSYTHRNHSYGGLNQWIPSYFDGFTTDYDARMPTAMAASQMFGMNEIADSAITTKAWAVRETHGVADNSYAPWTQSEFIDHIEHLAALRDQGKLWVAPPSKVIRYIDLTAQLQWNISVASDAYEVQWNTAIDSLTRYAVPLRIQVSGSWKAVQAGKDLGATSAAGATLISVDPSQGTLRLIPAP